MVRGDINNPIVDVRGDRNYSNVHRITTDPYVRNNGVMTGEAGAGGEGRNDRPQQMLELLGGIGGLG